MSLLLQLAINSLIAGSIYALVASGFSLIYNTNRFMHFAHGATIIISGYLLYTFYAIVGFSFFSSLISALFYASFLGLFIYRMVYYPLQKRKASKVILLIASLALLILFQNSIQMIFGANVKEIGFIEIKKGIEIGNAIITPLQIILIISALAVMGVTFFFMKKTKIGKEMRAVADNKELASIVGINYNKIYVISFLAGSFLASVAGALIALEQNITPYAGTSLMIKGFTGAVIGGLSSVPAAILGSYLLGSAENFGIAVLPSAYKDAISFVLLFLFLLFKPEGIVSIKRRIK